jgi:hypothetical protein
MSYRGSCVWPPIWVSVESAKRPRGEVGQLKEVRTYPTKSGETYLIIDCDGTQYAGCLLLDDKVFSEQLGHFLQSCCGMLIKDIGSLDIPPRLDLAKSYRKASGW